MQWSVSIYKFDPLFPKILVSSLLILFELRANWYDVSFNLLSFRLLNTFGIVKNLVKFIAISNKESYTIEDFITQVTFPNTWYNLINIFKADEVIKCNGIHIYWVCVLIKLFEMFRSVTFKWVDNKRTNNSVWDIKFS